MSGEILVKQWLSHAQISMADAYATMYTTLGKLINGQNDSAFARIDLQLSGTGTSSTHIAQIIGRALRSPYTYDVYIYGKK